GIELRKGRIAFAGIEPERLVREIAYRENELKFRALTDRHRGVGDHARDRLAPTQDLRLLVARPDGEERRAPPAQQEEGAQQRDEEGPLQSSPLGLVMASGVRISFSRSSSSQPFSRTSSYTPRPDSSASRATCVDRSYPI